MELADLLEVGKQQFPVVENGLGRGAFVHGLHVARHHLQHVAPELLFCLDQLADHGSVDERKDMSWWIQRRTCRYLSHMGNPLFLLHQLLTQRATSVISPFLGPTRPKGKCASGWILTPGLSNQISWSDVPHLALTNKTEKSGGKLGPLKSWHVWQSLYYIE